MKYIVSLIFLFVNSHVVLAISSPEGLIIFHLVPINCDVETCALHDNMLINVIIINKICFICLVFRCLGINTAAFTYVYHALHYATEEQVGVERQPQGMVVQGGVEQEIYEEESDGTAHRSP